MIQFDVKLGIETRNRAFDFSNHGSLVYRATKKKVSGTDTVNDPLTFCGLLIDGLSSSDGGGSMLVVLIKFILSG